MGSLIDHYHYHAETTLCAMSLCCCSGLVAALVVLAWAPQTDQHPIPFRMTMMTNTVIVTASSHSRTQSCPRSIGRDCGTDCA